MKQQLEAMLNWHLDQIEDDANKQVEQVIQVRRMLELLATPALPGLTEPAVQAAPAAPAATTVQLVALTATGGFVRLNPDGTWTMLTGTHCVPGDRSTTATPQPGA